MDDKVQQKLVELGYEPRKSEKASYPNLIAICRGYLGGLVFLQGEVMAKDRCKTIVRDEGSNIIITGSRTEDSNSLYRDFLKNTLEKDSVVDPRRSGYFSSVYISPLSRFKREGVCLDYISPSDNIYVVGAPHDQFTLVVEDIRKQHIASFYFWMKGGMLYVPKRG